MFRHSCPMPASVRMLCPGAVAENTHRASLRCSRKSATNVALMPRSVVRYDATGLRRTARMQYWNFVLQIMHAMPLARRGLTPCPDGMGILYNTWFSQRRVFSTTRGFRETAPCYGRRADDTWRRAREQQRGGTLTTWRGTEPVPAATSFHIGQ